MVCFPLPWVSPPLCFSLKEGKNAKKIKQGTKTKKTRKRRTGQLVGLGLSGHIFLAITRDKAHLLSASFSLVIVRKIWPERPRPTTNESLGISGSEITERQRNRNQIASESALSFLSLFFGNCLFFALAKKSLFFLSVFHSLRAQRLKKFKISLRDWNFQARLKFSSGPPTKPYFLWGILKVEIEIFNRDWNFQSRLNFFNLWALRVLFQGF